MVIGRDHDQRCRNLVLLHPEPRLARISDRVDSFMAKIHATFDEVARAWIETGDLAFCDGLMHACDQQPVGQPAREQFDCVRDPICSAGQHDHALCVRDVGGRLLFNLAQKYDEAGDQSANRREHSGTQQHDADGPALHSRPCSWRKTTDREVRPVRMATAPAIRTVAA